MGSQSLLKGLFLTQDWTQVSCTAGRFFTVWATSVALHNPWLDSSISSNGNWGYAGTSDTEKLYILRVNYKLLDLQLTGSVPQTHMLFEGQLYYINEFPNTVPTLPFRIKLFLDMMHFFLVIFCGMWPTRDQTCASLQWEDGVLTSRPSEKSWCIVFLMRCLILSTNTLFGICQGLNCVHLKCWVIANTLFQQHKRRLYTWTSPDGQHRNQIDYILCSQRWRSSIQSVKTRQSGLWLRSWTLYSKFRLKLKKVGKTTRPVKYDLNQIPYDYTREVTNRFKGLDLIDRVPDELWNEVRDIVQETGIKTIPMEEKCKKQNGWLRRPYK